MYTSIDWLSLAQASSRSLAYAEKEITNEYLLLWMHSIIQLLTFFVFTNASSFDDRSDLPKASVSAFTACNRCETDSIIATCRPLSTVNLWTYLIWICTQKWKCSAIFVGRDSWQSILHTYHEKRNLEEKRYSRSHPSTYLDTKSEKYNIPSKYSPDLRTSNGNVSHVPEMTLSMTPDFWENDINRMFTNIILTVHNKHDQHALQQSYGLVI